MDQLIITSWCVLVALTIWVFVDARSREWSRTGYRRWSPTFWAVSVLMLWPVVLPMYLSARRRAHPRSLKRCPRCAELVQVDAKVCRYCRHAFAPSTRA